MARECVYRYYDAAGRLIYVGVTARGIIRQHEHNRAADFWPYVARQEVDHCESRRHALDLEKRLIEEHRPPFNRTHNPDWQAIRAAYLTVIKAEEALASVQAGHAPTEHCGHCATCCGDVPPGPCRRAKINDEPCEICGDRRCLYAMGHRSGVVDAWCAEPEPEPQLSEFATWVLENWHTPAEANR